MANKTIYISRQDYSAAQDGSELNGYAPNTASEELGTVAETVTSSDTGIIPADFKDHKTVFLVTAGSGGATLTFSAGTTYGAKEKDIEVVEGTQIIWLDSTKFADNVTGEISFTTSASVDVVGYEMR